LRSTRGAPLLETGLAHSLDLLVVLDKVLETQRITRETRQLCQRVRDRIAPKNIIGAARPVQGVFAVIEQVAPSKATISFTGESGTGKGCSPATPNTKLELARAGMPQIPGATMAELECYVILETLKATGGSTSPAAEVLGISAWAIQYRLHDYHAVPGSTIPGCNGGHHLPHAFATR
jgi:DNA-binding NtrC family response regulator